MKHGTIRSPAATAGSGAGSAGSVLPGRDALSLRIQVEALLLDPRGGFRPRPITLRPAGAAGADDLLVMQVAEQADGCISVVTSEPLEPGQLFLVGGDAHGHEHAPHGQEHAPHGHGHAHGREYLLLGCRPGNRPEDGGQACWISVLRPQHPVPAADSGSASPAAGA